MDDELFSISFIIGRIAIGLPLIVTLVAGMIICYRQRHCRPRAARLLGRAMLAELIWDTVGGQAYFFALHSLGLIGDLFHQAGDVGWILTTILITLPSAAVQAVVWGCAFWAVLMIEDWTITEAAEAAHA